jgi:hypothetical protein
MGSGFTGGAIRPLSCAEQTVDTINRYAKTNRAPLRKRFLVAMASITSLYRQLPSTALHEPLVHINSDCDAIPGIPAVVQVISVVGVNDVHIIVVVPIV